MRCDIMYLIGLVSLWARSGEDQSFHSLALPCRQQAFVSGSCYQLLVVQCQCGGTVHGIVAPALERGETI